MHSMSTVLYFLELPGKLYFQIYLELKKYVEMKWMWNKASGGKYLNWHSMYSIFISLEHNVHMYVHYCTLYILVHMKKVGGGGVSYTVHSLQILTRRF
jgi:hypothetical protein